MKMKGKKAVSLSIETIVIIILAVLALIVVLFIFSSTMQDIFAFLVEKIKNVLGLWKGIGLE